MSRETRMPGVLPSGRHKAQRCCHLAAEPVDAEFNREYQSDQIGSDIEQHVEQLLVQLELHGRIERRRFQCAAPSS